jgi:oxysterol-binding protein 1
MSLLRGERQPKGDSDSESGSPVTRTTSNTNPFHGPPAGARSSSSVGAVDMGSPVPPSEPADSNSSFNTAEKIASSGPQGHKVSIEDSVRTFRVFEVLRAGDTAAISKMMSDPSSSSKLPGTSVLHLAIQCGEPPVVQVVLSSGGAEDLNSRDKEGNTPLHVASQLGRTLVVKQLLQHQDINQHIANHQGKTAIDLARNPEIFQELQLARSLFMDSLVRQVHGFVAQNDYRGLEELLVEPRAESFLDVNALELVTDRDVMTAGGTLLHEGARKKDTTLIQILLMHGADPFRRDRKGKLPQDVTKDERTRTILKKSPAAAMAQRGIQEKAILGSTPSQRLAAGGSVEAGKDSREMKGYLKKWTNYTSGYKLRWFVLEDGVLSYYKHQGRLAVLIAMVHDLDRVELT